MVIIDVFLEIEFWLSRFRDLRGFGFNDWFRDLLGLDFNDWLGDLLGLGFNDFITDR
jgi:hypothetical protein